MEEANMILLLLLFDGLINKSKMHSRLKRNKTKALVACFQSITET